MLTKIHEDLMSKLCTYRCDCGRIIRTYESQASRRRRCGDDCILYTIETETKAIENATRKIEWYSSTVVRDQEKIAALERKVAEATEQLESWKGKLERAEGRMQDHQARLAEVQADPRNVEWEKYVSRSRDQQEFMDAIERTALLRYGRKVDLRWWPGERLHDAFTEAFNSLGRFAPEAEFQTHPDLVRYWNAVDAIVAS